ncbi:MAG: COG4315 family predicted lipoprotein [Solirubrobacteraceae bacterium]
MSRNRTVLASAIVAVGLGAAPVIMTAGSAAATTGGASANRNAAFRAHAAAGPATISLRKTHRGRLLVNSRGVTLYAFSRDRTRRDRCVKIKGCTSVWPIVRTHGRPRAGHGVKRSKLGTIRLPNGKVQVTYAGHPLYTYTGDFGPGATSYLGFSMFGGRWPGLRASGALVN